MTSSSCSICLALVAGVGSISNNLPALRRFLPRRYRLSSSPSKVPIEVTDDDIAKGVVLHSFPNSARKVVKVSSDMVVKLGPDVHMAEAISMKFIRDHTTIPVPKVLNTYERDGYRYIIMEFVEGKLLKNIWPTLSRDNKSVILSELKDYISQIRKIRSPNNRISSVTGGPVVDRRQLSSISGGPFRLEADFNKWQLEQLKPTTPIAHRDIYIGMHKTDHKIVFSHGDLGFHNIIVEDGHVQAILDWEFAGWFSEHWDYKTLSFMSDTDEDYLCCKEIFGQGYYTEYLMDLWFTREVKHGGF